MDEAPHPTDQITGQGPHAPAEDDQEIVYYEGSPLLRGELGLLMVWLTVGLVVAALPVLMQVFGEAGPPWWLWVLIPVGIGLFFFPSLWVKRNRFKITNYRIDFEHGLITTNIDTLELWHVNDVRMRQGPLDKIFGVGSIHITSDDRSTPELELRSVSNPRPLFENLKQRVIAVKRQRGVIKMDVGG
ncbi:MAG: PH domain-containing protein [Planctomycetota bacterium]